MSLFVYVWAICFAKFDRELSEALIIIINSLPIGWTVDPMVYFMKKVSWSLHFSVCVQEILR